MKTVSSKTPAQAIFVWKAYKVIPNLLLGTLSSFSHPPLKAMFMLLPELIFTREDMRPLWGGKACLITLLYFCASNHIHSGYMKVRPGQSAER